MVPSGETPTAKSIAPPALFLRLQAPRNFAQSPAPTGLLLFRCLVSDGYSITDSLNTQPALGTAPKSTPSGCLLTARYKAPRVQQLEFIDTAVLHCRHQTVNAGEIARLISSRCAEKQFVVTDKHDPDHTLAVRIESYRRARHDACIDQFAQGHWANCRLVFPHGHVYTVSTPDLQVIPPTKNEVHILVQQGLR